MITAETKFKVGDKALYQECPPNWGKIREHCSMTNQALLAVPDFSTISTVEIVEVYPYDEDYKDPESYKIRFLDNPSQEETYAYAHHSELSKP